MDNQLLSRLQECISNLVDGNKDDSSFETFQDLMLYFVSDTSQYHDIKELQKVYPIQTPIIVGCSGKKIKKIPDVISRDIFISSRRRTESGSSTNQSSRSNNSSVDDNENNNNNLYEGQPLEMNVYANLSRADSADLNSPVFAKKEKTSFTPVQLSYGRRLLSAYTSLMLSPDIAKDGKELTTTPSLLLYCNGEDFYKTAYIYISLTIVDAKISLSYVQFSVQGAKVDSTIKSTPLPNMRQLSSLAEYNVYDGSKSHENVVVERASRIALEAEWDKSFTFLEKPASGAKMTVKARIASGDKNNPTYSTFKELSVLKSFVEGLGKGEVRWSTRDKDENSVLENLKELFEQLKLGDAYVESKTDNDEDKAKKTGDVRQNTLVTSRKDYDFTDKLWNVLINCTSYAELIECLEFMIEELKVKNIQPLVHKSNKTRIAETVRHSYTNEFCAPDMDGLLPLKLLIEIGFEKLQNDYISILIANDLTTSDQLVFYTDSSCNLLQKMERLEKLHNVYELVMLLNFYLQISESTLSSAARMALSHYQKQPLNDEHTFIIPVSCASVAEFLKSSQPVLWKLSLEDQTEGTVFAFFESLPFDHFHMKDDYPDGHSYYLVKLREHLLRL